MDYLEEVIDMFLGDDSTPCKYINVLRTCYDAEINKVYQHD